PKKCPFDAISIINTPGELDEPPLYQFGENTFRLFRLPHAKQGSVVGIIGSNGAGKTTAMKLIAGELVPNLGDWKKGSDWKRVIEHFKGKEIQGFFEQLSSKKLKVSLKPQEVDRIPKAVKGTAGDLLKKADERGVAGKYIEFLELQNCVENDVSELSGGELQRLAIAAASSREADLYLYDEPASFLDVRQRLNVAKALRELALSGKQVMVIEHDLAVLDYLSDYVQVLYGAPGVFGIVSNTKAVGVGVNQFLDGYLPDENVRIRETEIRFDTRPAALETESQKLFEYPEMAKRFEGFELATKPGFLFKGEVVGVLGPNATGKTTFVKMLAGVLKPDNCEVEQKSRVSYKPQYLESSFEGSVRELVQETEINNDVFKTEIEGPLEVSRLYEKQVKNLSGGELQRVSVALALAKDAGIYLVDEPTAFLDVTQRMAVGRAIQRITAERGAVALVVDHDLVFQDLVSNRMLVFEGIPGKKGHASTPASKRESMN
ncbi:MAG TPA: ribosome biogenesis/translation initiation ATPase RLI, partial [archaeon]|nr:ribosome biogenesis/translation initiation ATPase RLI [archaeon]